MRFFSVKKFAVACIAIVVALASVSVIIPISSSVAYAAGECPAGWTYEVAGGTCYQAFTAGATWTPAAGVTSITYLIVGGGGAGQGTVAGTTKGGAGGQVKTGTLSIGSTAITITVGAGGTSNAAGGASKLTQSAVDILTATGGAGASTTASGAGTGTNSNFTGTALQYGANGAPYHGVAGTRAGTAAVSSTNNCVGGGAAVANSGAGGGAGDTCLIDFGAGTTNSYTTGGAGGSGFVAIRYVAFGVTSFTTGMSATTNTHSSFTYTLSFISAVDATTLAGSDITNGGTSTGCVFTTSPTTGTASSFTVTVSGCSDGTVIPTLGSNSVTSSTGTNGPGAAYPGGTVTIDTTAPNAPTANDLVTASDTGSSTSDNITNDNTPTMSATGGTSGDTVTMTATNGGATQTCSYVLPATSCTFPALTDGTWDVTSTLTDPAGNVSPSSPSLPITIDTAAPSASAPDLQAATDTGASSTDNITNSTSPEFSVPGTNIGDSVTVSAVNGGTTKTCTYVVTALVNSCAMSGVTAGTWSVTDVVTDAAGNVSSTSSALSMTVDTTAPAAPSTPDLVASSDTGSSNTDNVTADTTPAMSATGGTTGETITITAVNGGSTQSCSYVIPATSCDLPALSDGVWSVTSTLTDLAGNTSVASSALSLTIDTAAPSTPSSAPDLATSSDTGTSSTDNYTSDNTPTINGVGGVTGQTVTVYASNGTSTLSCSYVLPATSCDLPTLSDGTWSITNTVTDSAGNVSSAGGALSITVDTAAPSSPSAPDLNTSSDLGSSASDNLTSDNTPSMSASGGNNGDTVTISATKGGTTVTCSYVVGQATSCDLPTLSDGTWVITSTLTDSAGNTSAPSSPLSITIDTSAPVAPSTPDLVASSDTGSSNTDNLTSDTTPTMSASGGTTGDTVTITATNGGLTVSCTYVVGTASSCDLPTLSDGTWSVSSTLTDPSGNTSPASSPLSLVIDSAAPTAPLSAPDLASSSDTGSSNTDNITSDNTPTINGVGGITGQTITVNATNGSSTVSCTYVIGVATSCDLPTLSDGTWSVSNTITDAAGNTSAAGPSLNVVIDTTAPNSNIPDLVTTSDTGLSTTDNVTNDTTPAMSAIGAVSGDSVTMSATKGGTTVTCTYVVGVATSCDLPTLSDGTWSITNTITDAAGNVSSPSSPLSLVVDTSVPASPSGPDLLPSSDFGASNTDNLTSDTTPAMSANGGASGDKVTITATDGTHTVSCSYVVGVATSCDLPTMSDGTWTIDATVTDPAGNTSPAGPGFSMVVDGTAPTTPASAPDLAANSDTGQSATDNYTADNTPTINVSGGVSGDKITVSAIKDGAIVSCSFIVGVATSCDLPTLADGEWSVFYFVTDPAGNVSSSSPSLSITIDTTATIQGVPDMLDSSDTGLSNTDNVTGDTTPAFTNPSASPGDIVTVIAKKGSETVSCSYLAGKASSCDLPTMSDGSWVVITEITDLAGNVSRTSPILVAVADSTIKKAPSQKAFVASLQGGQIIHAPTFKTYSSGGASPNYILSGRALSRALYFAPASAHLDRWDRRMLQMVAQRIKSKKGEVLITGYARQNLTDTANFLMDLSVRRALAVAHYLVSQGVTCTIKYDAVGARTTTVGTPIDRRVEIRWSSTK